LGKEEKEMGKTEGASRGGTFGKERLGPGFHPVEKHIPPPEGVKSKGSSAIPGDSGAQDYQKD